MKAHQFSRVCTKLAPRRQPTPPAARLPVCASSAWGLEGAFVLASVVALGTTLQRPMWPKQQRLKESRTQRSKEDLTTAQIEADGRFRRSQLQKESDTTSDWLPRGQSGRATQLDQMSSGWVPSLDPLDPEQEGWEWALLGSLACFPYLGSLSWVVLATIDPLFDTGLSTQQRNEDRRRYGIYSLLYSLAFLLPDDPLLRVTSIVVCALHFQLERIARTEGLTETPVLNDVWKALSSTSPALVADSTGRREELAQGGSDKRGQATGSSTDGLDGGDDKRLEQLFEDAGATAAKVVFASRRFPSKMKDELEKLELQEQDAKAEEQQNLAREATILEAAAWERRMQLRALTVQQLRVLAKDLGLRRYSTLKKSELVDLVEPELEDLSEDDMARLGLLAPDTGSDAER